MAGHSAWKNIKHRKAAVDAKRGRIWSKLSRAIIVAAKAGGGDPRFNATLRLAIDDAKAGNMPRDTIEKAVRKGSGEDGAEDFQAVRYEGYGPGGVALIAESLVANPNKTAAEIRTIFDKNGGSLGVPGCVSYCFSQCGRALVEREAAEEERLMEVALAAGADDVLDAGDGWEVRCPPTALTALRDALSGASVTVASAEVAWIPAAEIAIDAAQVAQLEKLVDALEDHDDVQKVFTNAADPG